MKAHKQKLSPAEAVEARQTLKRHESDVGSTAVQVAALTARIVHLTGHMVSNRNDKHSRRGLIGLVSKRRKLLKYLKRTDSVLHGKTLASLGLRK